MNEESPLTSQEEAEARLDTIQHQINLLRNCLDEVWKRTDLNALERAEIELHNLIRLL
jgi:hypothetical protein